MVSRTLPRQRSSASRLDNVKHPDYESTTKKRPCREDHNTDIRRVPRILRSAFCRRYGHPSNRHISNRHTARRRKRLQEAVTCWSDGLQATGGSLKHKKCYYYSISYVWKNGNWSYGEPSPDSHGIVLPNETGILHPIKLLGRNETVKTLGLFTTPTGNMSDQL